MAGMGGGTFTLDQGGLEISDESKFNLFGSDGCHWCWKKPGEEFDERYVRKEVKHGHGGDGLGLHYHNEDGPHC